MVVEFNTLADWDNFSKRLSYSLIKLGYIYESKKIERFSYSFFPSSTEYLGEFHTVLKELIGSRIELDSDTMEEIRIAIRTIDQAFDKSNNIK